MEREGIGLQQYKYFDKHFGLENIHNDSIASKTQYLAYYLRQ